MAYLIVFVGAGIGGMLRHGANVLAARLLGFGFPYGTLFVNIAGGFLLGVLAEWLLIKGIGNQPLRLFLTTGILGGFTTFSAFSLDAAVMWQRGDYLLCAGYTAGSVLFSVAALFLGMAAVKALI
jgi:fluoride exporter